MSDSYSFLSKNFVLSECKGTKKMRNGKIAHFAFFWNFFITELYFRWTLLPDKAHFLLPIGLSSA